MIKKIRADKRLQSYLLSAFFAIALILHLLRSDLIVAGSTLTDASDKQSLPSETSATAQPKVSESATAVPVEVRTVRAEQIEGTLTLYGNTHPNRTVTLKSTLSEEVKAIKARKGDILPAGTPLVSLDTRKLEAELAHAKAQLKQAELDYASAVKLEQSGLQSRLRLADTKTRLASAKSHLTQLKVNLARSEITTPFRGVFNDHTVETGDFVQPGDPVAELLDLNPLIVNIYIPETAIGAIKKGAGATVRLWDREEHEATIRFVSRHAYEGTNTFLAEVAIDNKDYSLPAGISAKVTVQTGKRMATPLTPALLALNDDGDSGVYIVENNRAIFKQAGILTSTAGKVWIDPLGESAQVIVAGHQGLADGSPVIVQQKDKEKTP